MIGETPIALERIKRTFPFGIKIIEPLTDEWKKLGVKQELFILVRPDNYMALICDSFNETEVGNYLKKYFS